MADMVQVRRGGVKSYEGPDAKIGRSQFNRSHGLKMSFDASYLYPILIDEVLPGDTFTCNMNGFARIFSPLDAPVMDNIELETFFFFVPNRLVWEHWEDFMGQHDAAGAQDTSYTVPVLASGFTVDHDNVVTGHGLAAYMGLPEGLTTAGVTGISSLPFRGYNRIFDDWFRDQNLQDDPHLAVDDTADTVGEYAVLKSNKKHDYFTSALPYLQKGTAVTTSVTLSGMARVETTAQLGQYISVHSSAAGYGDSRRIQTDVPDATLATETVGGAASIHANLAQTHLTTPVGTLDINALRESVAIQRLLERDARGGTRYVEIIKSHFGVTSPDFRLQRTEYLGGGKSFINISPVANTSATDTEDQAELRGIGSGSINGHGWAKSFTEHGNIIGLIRARGDITYFQGVDRLWSRSTRYDFYIPALAMLGEQSILKKEIFVSNSAATDDAVFGYQERWAEYRMKHSRVVGVFNPDVSGALSHWHLAEDFGSVPTLNTAFVNDQTPMSRVTTVDSEPDFLLDLWFNYKCARPIPVRSVPSLIGRF